MDSGIEYLMDGWKARAEAAEAENVKLRKVLQVCANAPLSGWTIAQGYARRALGGEHE